MSTVSPGPDAVTDAWMLVASQPAAQTARVCAAYEGPAQVAASTHVATSAARTRQDRIGGDLLGSGPGPQWTADDARGNPARGRSDICPVYRPLRRRRTRGSPPRAAPGPPTRTRTASRRTPP